MRKKRGECWQSEAAEPRSVGIAKRRQMTNTALSALYSAWITTTIATSLLSAALALSRVWDGAIFMHALRDTLIHPN